MWPIAIEAFKCQLIGCKTMKTKLICRSLARNRALLYQLSKLPVFVLSDISIHCLNEAVVKVLWFDIHIFMYLYTYCTSQILCLEKVVLFHKVFIAHVCTLHIVCFCAESIKAWHCFINAVSDYNPLSASQLLLHSK